ncbi:MAG: dephospho-CoA kinase [Acidimicrobiales bacterium]
MAQLLVGLTGDLGAGKSTVGRALAERGAWVIDADLIARQVLSRGSPGERAVLERFGSSVASTDGSLDRRALAQVVFAQTEARLALEAIAHPLIEQEITRQVAGLPAGVVVIELPLLDGERRKRYLLDVVVLVEAPQEVEVSRAVAQRGMAEADVRARLAAVASRDGRRSIADRVIVNAGSREDLLRAVDELWSWLDDLAQLRGAKAKGEGRPGA